MIDLLFKSQTNRNIRAVALKREGYQVKKYSVRNQQIHPQYIEDEAEYLREQKGFGNTVYNTLYKVLYGIKAIETSNSHVFFS